MIPLKYSLEITFIWKSFLKSWKCFISSNPHFVNGTPAYWWKFIANSFWMVRPFLMLFYFSFPSSFALAVISGLAQQRSSLFSILMRHRLLPFYVETFIKNKLHTIVEHVLFQINPLAVVARALGVSLSTVAMCFASKCGMSLVST